MNIDGLPGEFLQTEYYYTDTLLSALTEKSITGSREDMDFVYRIQKLLDSCISFLRKLTPYDALIYTLEEINKFYSEPQDDDYKISCSKGCSSCCYINVCITKPEAEVLANKLKQIFSPIDLLLNIEYLQKQQHVGESVENWNKLAFQEQACVFLNRATGECRVYADRPVACRIHQVITPPDLCDPVKYPHGKIGRVFNYKLEIIQSAMLNVFENSNMPNMILKELKNETC